MLSYQHAYHAGNLADLHKHRVLAGLLELLTVKPRAITYIETHAGRGLYDLGAPEALKTGEATEAIARCTLPTGAYRDAVMAVRSSAGASAYPGSPMIARHCLRPDDRLILMERHKAEHRHLMTAFRSAPAEIHLRDGYEGLLALTPPTPRRGLVLIDPSYEIKDEYKTIPRTVQKLLRRWPESAVMIWYPLLEAGREAALKAGLHAFDPLFDEVRFAPGSTLRMAGSGIALLNAPYGSSELFAADQRIETAFGRV